MILKTLYSGSGSGAQASVPFWNFPSTTGNLQFVGGAASVLIQGSCDNTNFIDVVTLNSTTRGAHVAMFPFMRANITTPGGNNTIFITQ